MEYSPRCRIAVDYVKQAYRRLGHPYVTSAHLVLGLVTLNGGVGDTVLKRSGLSADLIECFLSSQCIAGEETVDQHGAVFGRSAISALSRAELEATRFGHAILGVEHLALALLAEDHGVANDLFASAQVKRENTRATILQDMK
jgi:ATP-dependent Clp protease ATP-binding subunit ClpC